MSHKLDGMSIARRNARGIAMAEGAVGIVLVGAILIPMLILFSNMVAQLLLQGRVAQVANQVAATIDDRKYWLGMRRPGYDQEKGSQDAATVASVLCNEVGLTYLNVDLVFPDGLRPAKAANGIHDPQPYHEMTTCRVNANAIASIPFRFKVLGFDMANLFPGNVSAVGVASHGRINPYALVHMGAPQTIDNQDAPRDVAVIPAYGFFQSDKNGAEVGPIGEGVAEGMGICTEPRAQNMYGFNHYFLGAKALEQVNGTPASNFPINSWYQTRRHGGVWKTVN